LRQGVRTRDLGGQESTDSVTEAVVARVTRRLAPKHQPRLETSASWATDPSSRTRNFNGCGGRGRAAG